MNDYNPILDSDSYKASHWVQYPPGTRYVYSYIESRGGRFDFTLWFGLQYFLKRYLTTRISRAMVDEAEALIRAHGEPFNRAGWDYIVERLDGRIPLEIRAVAEGSRVPVRNVLATVVNTDPNCYWVTSYFETALLRAAWYPSTVATLSKACKDQIAAAMRRSSDSLDGLEFKLHDFGARGVSSHEASQIGGAAHLVNFSGTDTLMAVRTLMRYYGASDMPAFSIPAAEHSTITAWGEQGELDAYRNMLEQFGGQFPLFAVVSDSWDIYRAVTELWGGALRQQVLDSGSMLVIRPDSGEPRQVVPEVLERLHERFGSRVNGKGYRVLDGVRVIQGDGIDVDSLSGIMDNLAFGMGGGLLQQVNRDTQRFAMKCSAVAVDGRWRDVYKDPVGDPGKRSKRGRLALVADRHAGFRTVAVDQAEPDRNLLRPVFRDGELLCDWDFDGVRRRANR
jgi:nicotinamide phosphoribosyltransferase